MHEISAIVGPAETLSVIERTCPGVVVVSLAEGLSIVALDPMTLDAIGCELDLGDLEEMTDPNELRARIAGVVTALCHVGVQGKWGLIFTQYFGGAGTQAACLVEQEGIVFGPIVGEGSINLVLARLGIRPQTGDIDEFQAVGLDRWRNSEDIRASG